MEKNYDDLIQESFTEKITEKIVRHRNNFHQIMTNRYAEFLPLTIGYENLYGTQLNQLRIEYLLRSGYAVAIGELSTGLIGLLGVINNFSKRYENDFQNVLKPLTKKDINFTISKILQCSDYSEICDYDCYTSGNFVVLTNKPYSLNNDFNIIKHYVDEMTEIIVSRYSISMQAKINTFLRDEFNSEDMEDIASDLYNGKPWIKTSTKFDINEHIINISNTTFVSALTELKRTYQNIIAELNSMLGLNALGVDKESGVSENEANSNKSFRKSNESIYLRARNEPLSHLNEIFKTNLKAEYVDSMVKELSSIEKLEVFEHV